MKIAIPMSEGKLAMHFGHCAQFSIIEADKASKAMSARNDIDAPPHEPGLLPKWLAEKGVNMVIAGGMGSRAQDLFIQNKIQVITGAPPETPEKLVESYLNGSLVSGPNCCDH